MRATLDDLGHDAKSVSELAPHASETEVLALALAEQRILITEDKDFGELPVGQMIVVTRSRVRVRHRARDQA